jgi:hypothetical protein
MNLIDYFHIATAIVAAASALAAAFGFHKFDGPLGVAGKVINGIALNFGGAKPESK